MKRKSPLTILILGSILIMTSMLSGVSAAGPTPAGISVGLRGGWDVRVTPDEQVSLLDSAGRTTTIGKGLHAQVDHQGNVYFGSWEQGLMAYERRTGQVTQLAEPMTVSPPFLLDPAGKILAVHIHDDFMDSDNPVTTGIALLDLTTRDLKPVLVVRYNYALAFGWRGEDLFIQTFGHDTGHPVFEVLDTKGNRTPLPENDLPYTHHFPQVSPDQQYLTYEYPGTVALIDMSRGTINKITGVSSPRWQGTRLFGTVNGKDREITVPASR